MGSMSGWAVMTSPVRYRMVEIPTELSEDNRIAATGPSGPPRAAAGLACNPAPPCRMHRPANVGSESDRNFLRCRGRI
jgi:hypothetical protein